ncbi:hypothetical protein ABDD95_16445 [Mucilaginibacter sp. PAMB04274]|uniref:hypothetical protein n=1 Tax=Mucilaginibacter sp. PAMB04274 TaxID=3138568 RepID=UPI0031F6BC53
MKKQYWAPLILGITLLVTLVIGVFSYIAPPAIFPDPSWGFQTMRSMEMGGDFNMLVGPDQDNISKDTGMFLTWWSPGQYLVPYFFKTVFGLNTGQASAVTSVLCEMLGLFGFYAFFKKVGFKPLLAAASVAFVACQQFYYIPYIFYNGGEVLMFAYAGWFLYGCFSFRKIDVLLILFVLIAGWVGFFTKSSMMLVYMAGLLCMWINISPPRKDYAAWLKNGFAIGIPALISLACVYLFFLSKGDNPAAAHSAGWRVIWETFTFPLASPLLAGFSVDELAKGLVYHPDGPMFPHVWTVIILVALAVASLWLVLSIVRHIPHSPYKIAVAVYYIVFVLFFGYSFFRQAAISYEGRHFRLVGLLVIPGALYLVGRAGLFYRAAFALVWLFITFSSFKSLIHEYHYNSTEGVRGPSGLTQQFIDQPTLNYLLQADNRERDGIFVFTSADIGLEIRHNRIITIEPIGLDVKVDYQDYLYNGHAGPLHIVLPADYEQNGRAQFILKCFPGYKGFVTKKLSEDYTVFEAR